MSDFSKLKHETLASSVTQLTKILSTEKEDKARLLKRMEELETENKILRYDYEAGMTRERGLTKENTELAQTNHVLSQKLENARESIDSILCAINRWNDLESSILLDFDTSGDPTGKMSVDVDMLDSFRKEMTEIENLLNKAKA